MILPGDGSIDSLLRMARNNNINNNTFQKPTLQPKSGLRSPRKHLLQAPVLQVVYASTIKDRYLFLFSDLLLICKPIMDESIIVSSPINPDSESRSRFKSTESSLFQIKNIVELAQMTLFLSREDQPSFDNRHSMNNSPGATGSGVGAASGSDKISGGGVRQSLPAPRKMHPMLVTALRKFQTSAESGVAYLIDKNVLIQEPLSIAGFLFKTPDLSRRQLGYYLSDRNNNDIYEAFLNCFRLVGLRLDEALRILLTTFRLPSQWENIEYIIEQFAKKWHDANQNVIKFHEDMVVKVIVAMLFLNAEIWYDASKERDVFWFARERKEREDRLRLLRRGSIDVHKHRGSVAFEPLHYITSVRTKGSRRPTVEDFLERWKYYDQYELVEAEFLEEMYRSIVAERLETGWDTRPGKTEEQETDIVITVDANQLPSRLTRNVPCLPIRISIPSPDPGLQIKLRGQDLLCQPNILDFSQSAVQSFTVTGHTLGRTSLMFIKSGFNAGRYVSPTLPRTKSIVVERLFMRYTFQIGFYPVEQPDHVEAQIMHKYTFSVENEEERKLWIDYLKQLCGRVSVGPFEARPMASRMSCEEKVGLQVLRDVLLAEDVRKHSMVRYSLFNKAGTPARNSEDKEKDKSEEATLLPSTTHAVTKRGHEIVHLVVQNALVPRMLGFLKQQIQ
ncbi:hypothetical protein J3Q64DRAFT_1756853 [Phycomyces blakesleeanus]|uniref:SEC7 domain-containing protein n=1 Tax=Phycomyces blakesleeanus TaxID=4837 RepID=A0ABR3AS40_PHYBL